MPYTLYKLFDLRRYDTCRFGLLNNNNLFGHVSPDGLALVSASRNLAHIVLDVEAGARVERLPEQRGRVEEEGLEQEDVGHPLVVEDAVRLELLALRQLRAVADGHEVAGDVAEGLGVVAAAARVLVHAPALVGLADQLVGAQDGGEDDHHDGAELARQLVHRVVALQLLEVVARELLVVGDQVQKHPPEQNTFSSKLI